MDKVTLSLLLAASDAPFLPVLHGKGDVLLLMLPSCSGDEDKVDANKAMTL